MTILALGTAIRVRVVRLGVHNTTGAAMPTLPAEVWGLILSCIHVSDFRTFGRAAAVCRQWNRVVNQIIGNDKKLQRLLMLFKYAKGMSPSALQGHTKAVSRIWPSPNFETFVSSSFDRTLRVWAGENCIDTIRSNQTAWNAAIMSNGLLVYDLTRDDIKCMVPGPGNRISAICHGEEIIVYDLTSKQMTISPDYHPTSTKTKIATDLNGNLLYVAVSAGNQVLCLNADLSLSHRICVPGKLVSSMIVDTDGTLIIASVEWHSEETLLTRWSGKKLVKKRNIEPYVSSMQIGPEGFLYAVCKQLLTVLDKNFVLIISIRIPYLWSIAVTHRGIAAIAKPGPDVTWYSLE